ncbi:Uncharacterized protein Fot_36423 [Forsythia ovata]|uniref:Uncharacterized protein n=1 Tax=Forsythia ovata TaxID=205694 RepID=A0ABD1SPM0_9LAMI
MSDFTKLRDKYWIPEGFGLIFSAKADWPCSPPHGHVAVMSDAFECGMKLSLHPIFKDILRSYNLCPYQREREPKKGVKDWYYLTPRGSYSVESSPGTHHPSSTRRANGYGQLGLAGLPKSPGQFLTEKDLKVIGRLYSYKGDFSGIICTD